MARSPPSLVTTAVRMTPPDEPSRAMANATAVGGRAAALPPTAGYRPDAVSVPLVGISHTHGRTVRTCPHKLQALVLAHAVLVVGIAKAVNVRGPGTLKDARFEASRQGTARQAGGQRDGRSLGRARSEGHVPPIANGCLCIAPPNGMLYTAPPLWASQPATMIAAESPSLLL